MGKKILIGAEGTKKGTVSDLEIGKWMRKLIAKEQKTGKKSTAGWRKETKSPLSYIFRLLHQKKNQGIIIIFKEKTKKGKMVIIII